MTRFTRLSVVASQRQLDASLPAERPVGEFLAELSDLFSLPTTNPPTTWALSTPRQGLIPTERTLDDVGVLDGDVLYLSPAANAAESPVVDDVLTAVEQTWETRGRPWSGIDRDRVCTVLLVPLVLSLVGALATVPDAGAGGLLLGTFVVLALASRALLSRGGMVLAWAGLPATLLGTFRLFGGQPLPVRLTAAVSAGLLGVAVVALAARLRRGVVIAGVVTGLAGGLVSVALAATAPAVAVAGWAVPALVLAIGVLPQMSVVSSGLLALVRQVESGTPAGREQFDRALGAGQATVDGTVAAVGMLAAAAAATLVSTGQPWQAVLGGLLGLVFLLRSRGFSQARQVGFLLVVPVLAMLGAVAALPRWVDGVAGPWQRSGLWVAGVVVVAGLVSAAGFLRFGEVSAARLSRFYDRVDTLALLAVVPMVLVAQVFT
ncbi:MAG TPA: EsaB/YukD family protein [Mycobacteriales bacterium]|nr:EsaB/YukD family protein [Mycobacteriales bacterium]